MRVLAVNAGSSSLKLRLLGPDDELLDEAAIAPWNTADIAPAVERLCSPPEAVGHRVVHGGERREPVLIDQPVEADLAALTPLAPVHQPLALAAIRVVQRALPGVPAVACFDTAYHASLPAAAATYALPAAWRERYGLKRYGFHGLSHAYAARRAGEMLGRDRARRAVTCHLGAGASLCASLDYRSVDTTMGFTPLEGLVMATRSGSVDPGLVLWLATEARIAPEEIAHQLETASGLAGLTGGSGDMRDVIAARARGEARAVLAFDVYIHRLTREIAAMTVALGGLDVLVFTGGVGEHVPEVRHEAVVRLGFLGISIDGERNAGAVAGDTNITGADSAVATVVIESREDVEIARDTRAVLAGRA